MIFYVFLSFLLMIIFLTREKEKTKLYIISMILQLLYIILIFIIFEILSLYNSRFINFYLNYNGTEIFLIDFQNNNFVNNFGIKTLQNLYLKYFFTILSGIIISLNFYLFVNNVRPKILKYLKIKKD